jgi:hypothetical protein
MLPSENARTWETFFLFFLFRFDDVNSTVLRGHKGWLSGVEVLKWE